MKKGTHPRTKRYRLFHNKLKQLRSYEGFVKKDRREVASLKQQLWDMGMAIDKRIPSHVRKQLRRTFKRLIPNYSNGATAYLERYVSRQLKTDESKLAISIHASVEGKTDAERERNAIIINLILESNLKRLLCKEWDNQHRSSFVWDEHHREYLLWGTITYPTKELCPNFYKEYNDAKRKLDKANAESAAYIKELLDNENNQPNK